MHINNPFSSVSSDPLERAKSLLVHYFQVASGNTFSGDSVSEVASIVDNISDAIEAAKPENKLKKLEQEVRILTESEKSKDYWLEKILQRLNRLEDLGGQNSKIVEELKTELSDYFAE